MNKYFVMFILAICVRALVCEDQMPGSPDVISKTVDGMPDIEIISSVNLAQSEPTFGELCKPIAFTRSGLTCYFKHIYNCENYARQVLIIFPFQHMQEFLTHGTNTNQPRAYTQAVFTLFEKKIKSAPSINATAMLPFLQALPTFIQQELDQKQSKKTAIKSIVRRELETNFDILKSDPEFFLDALSQKIIDLDTNPAFMSREQLLFTITKFIDTCLGKLIWVASEKEEVWNNFFALGKELAKLHELGIIRSKEDLDVCQWTLNSSFCTYLSYAGAQLDFVFFERAVQDLRCGIKHFDDLPEQEHLMATKTKQLTEAIITSRFKAEKSSIY